MTIHPAKKIIPLPNFYLMLSFSTGMGLAYLQGNDASWHLQVALSSRAHVLFLLRLQKFLQLLGLRVSPYPSHSIVNSLRILKLSAGPYLPCPQAPPTLSWGVQIRGALLSATAGPPSFSLFGQLIQAALASDLSSQPWVPCRQVLLVQQP